MHIMLNPDIKKAILVGGFTFGTTVGLGYGMNTFTSRETSSPPVAPTRSIDDPSLARSIGTDVTGTDASIVDDDIPAYESLPEYHDIQSFFNGGRKKNDIFEQRDWFLTPGTRGHEFLAMNGLSTSRMDIIGDSWTPHVQTLMAIYERFPGFLTPEQLRLCQLMVNMSYINRQNQIDSLGIVRANPNRLTAGFIVYPREEVAGRINGLLKPEFSYSRYVTKVNSEEKKGGKPMEVEERCDNEEKCPPAAKVEPTPEKVTEQQATETPTPVPTETETPTATPTATNTPRPSGGGGGGGEQAAPTATSAPVVPTESPTVIPATSGVPTTGPTAEVSTPSPAPTNIETLPTFTAGVTSTLVPTRTPGGLTPTILGTQEATVVVAVPTSAPTNIETLPTKTIGPTTAPASTRTSAPMPTTVPTVVGTARPVPTAGPTKAATSPPPPPPTAVGA